MILELLGYSAGFLMAATMVPQILQSIKTKKVEDISIYMILIYIISSILWVIYGIGIGALPVAIADAFACMIGCLQLFLKIKYS